MTKLVYENSSWEGACTLSINGNALPAGEQKRRYDVNNCEVDITPFIKKGEGIQSNYIRVAIKNGALKEPLRLFGDFSVSFPYSVFPPPQIDYRKRKKNIACPVSWCDAGFPHYSGTMIYSKHVRIPDEWNNNTCNYRLYLHVDEINDVSLLAINGKKAGTRISAPFIWDVTDFLVKGDNSVVFEVANSPLALIEGGIKKSGIAGKICLVKYCNKIRTRKVVSL